MAKSKCLSVLYQTILSDPDRSVVDHSIQDYFIIHIGIICFPIACAWLLAAPCGQADGVQIKVTIHLN
jgi:hypothetical protein